MKYDFISQQKDSLLEFSSLKDGDVFSFFEPNTLAKGNHSIYMKIRSSTNLQAVFDLVDLSDGKLYSFSEKRRNTILDLEEKIGNKVYKLDAIINIIL